MTYQYHNENTTIELPQNTVFVFGSNLAGQHDDGAARIAAHHFGAVAGVGRGWMGQSFAIPTVNEHFQSMPLSQIAHYVDDFKIYAQNHPNNCYFVTALGCGMAGYKVSEIAPLFKGIHDNVIFPESFKPYVDEHAISDFPTINAHFLQQLLTEDVVLYFDAGYDCVEDALAKTDLNLSERDLAALLINEPMYPEDRYGRGREYEIADLVSKLKGSLISAYAQGETPQLMCAVLLTLMELYDCDEQTLKLVWSDQIQLVHPSQRAA